MEYRQGNIFVRQMPFEKAGDMVHGHAHNFDHTTYVSRGALLVEVVEITPAVYAESDWHLETVDKNGTPTTVIKYSDGAQPITPEIVKVIKSVTKRASDGFNFILIQAGVCHRLTALEDHSMGHCIYAHRDPQGEVVQDYDGWSPGYV